MFCIGIHAKSQGIPFLIKSLKKNLALSIIDHKQLISNFRFINTKTINYR